MNRLHSCNGECERYDHACARQLIIGLKMSESCIFLSTNDINVILHTLQDLLDNDIIDYVNVIDFSNCQGTESLGLYLHNRMDARLKYNDTIAYEFKQTILLFLNFDRYMHYHSNWLVELGILEFEANMEESRFQIIVHSKEE